MPDKSTPNLLKENEALEKEIKQLKSQKRYGLVWEDKIEKFDKESKDALPILRETGNEYPDIITDKNEGFNILIEGDNYHSLSVLSYTHRNKIDVIYIDPPYNTGNKDFIYNDHYVDKEDRFRHSKWLSFMEKRLKLARKLLKDSGAIFISIDENEQSPLRMLCDKIFGDNNFVANLIWKSKSGGANDSRFFAVDHEYIMVFAKNADTFKLNLDAEAEVTTSYNLHDEKGWYALDRLDKQSIRYSPSLDYKIVGPDGKAYYPKHKNVDHPNATWRWGKKTVQERYDELVFKNGCVYTKNYQKEDGSIPRSLLIDERFGRTRTGKTELYELFGREVFSNPKPSKLIRHLVNLIPNKNSVVLDFMAGSGTTGHAVLQCNKDDGGNRKFILCTNNENNICTNVCYPRVKKVIEGYKNSKDENVVGLGGNLKYLKADFVKLEKSVDTLKYKIVEGSTEILCLKEGTFNLVSDSYKKNRIKIFQNNDKYTAILFDLFYFDDFVEQLKQLKDKPVSVYVFSYTKDFSKKEFGNLDIKFTIEPIPEKILETYKDIFHF